MDKILIDIAPLNWEIRSEETIRATISTAAFFVAQNVAVDAVCSNYVVSDQYHSGNNKPCISFNSATQIYINDDTHTFTTKEDAQQYLTGATLCYKLATPTTIQLTPQQIQLLKGTNTLTTNGTNITLTYQPDNLVGAVMEQVEPQIEDLQGQIDEIPRLVDYSTAEQNTGRKWINGKDIYVRTFDFSLSPITLVRDNFVSTGIDASEMENIIDNKVYAPTEGPLGFVEVSLEGSGAERTAKLQMESFANLSRVCTYLVLEYTKSTT